MVDGVVWGRPRRRPRGIYAFGLPFQIVRFAGSAGILIYLYLQREFEMKLLGVAGVGGVGDIGFGLSD